MIDPEMMIDILYRIEETRRARCGARWVSPPADWPVIVKKAWPRLWAEAPSIVPAGWCDLLMAFSEHMIEIADGRDLSFSAMPDLHTGGLAIVRHHEYLGRPEETDTMLGYQSVAASTCHACGDPGEPRRLERLKITRILCDDHYEGS